MSAQKKSYWRKIFLLDTFLKYIVSNNRIFFFKYFCDSIKFDDKSTILDVGTTPSTEDHENLFIKLFPYKFNITCLSNTDCTSIKDKFKVLNFILGDARASNLEDNSFDIVHSNAVIEHVGNYLEQKTFIKECYRIAKKDIFITTPYRFFPIEMHTKLPLIHFLPKKIFRKIISLFGDNFFSLEKNLNLLSIKEIECMLKDLNISTYTIKKNKLFFFTSNIILFIKK